MTKQELASKIWATANELRKNIKASEYKDYILGFMFYKYLSDKELDFLSEQSVVLEELKTADKSDIKWVRDNIGYFIRHDDLFQVWKNNKKLGAKEVSEAISHFYDSMISDESDNPSDSNEKKDIDYSRFFKDIFSVLSSGLTKLGENAGSRDAAVRSIVDLIDQIPCKSKDYDVLGYIYEYLIKQFSSEAKKDGAFYTPHGITSLMAKIVAERIKGRDKITVYDPTVGTAGLLLNIGKETGRYINPDNIRYYGQELITETCNLAKMNLFMQGIRIQNISVRNGDTLKEDWPYFDDDTAYEAVPVDIVVSNPPYSQGWDPDTYKLDPRFRPYGLAPNSKADYAFLLHCLYHVKNKEGIMAIVLPHGVLFRGGTEYDIRKNLVDKHNIEAIIGFPSNMFFSTGIPVIVMVLSNGRQDSDILFVDASESYGKEATQNFLREMDIQRIADVINNRESIPNFSRLVTLEEIVRNDYNLNIPRYISAKGENVPVDPYSVMTGKIAPEAIQQYDTYWSLFPTLKSALFTQEGRYYSFCAKDHKEIVFADKDVRKFIAKVNGISAKFKDYLISRLISSVPTLQEHTVITEELFRMYTGIDLIDSYSVYQAFSDEWKIIEGDIARISEEGKDICRETEPNMVLQKNSDKKYEEVQKGIKGKILPINMIQSAFFGDELSTLDELNAKVSELESEIAELWEGLEDEIKAKLSKEDDDTNSNMDSKKFDAAVKEILAQMTVPESEILDVYLEIRGKAEKLQFIEEHKDIAWQDMNQNKDGTYGAAAVRAYLDSIKMNCDDDSDNGKIISIKRKTVEKAAAAKKAKTAAKALEEKAVARMAEMTNEEMDMLLTQKWIAPIMSRIEMDMQAVLMKLVSGLSALREEYGSPMPEIDGQIAQVELSLSEMLIHLTGNAEDMEAIELFRKELFS